ncbi:MAG: hypothetical protein IJJ26_12080 [Victivallales bacterium]|nr:hypothetical protein [Victivallales bacterium]
MKSTLFAVLMLAVSSVFAADTFWRIDVSPIKDNMAPVSPVETEMAKPRHPEWEKDEAKKAAALIYQSKKALPAGEWTTCEITFKAEGNGKTYVNLSGGWAKEVKDRTWVYIRNVKVNGESYKGNGDLKKVWKEKKNGDRFIPSGFWMNVKAKYLEDFEGAPAILCNYDSKLILNIDLTEGTTYVVSCEMKPAPTPAE